MTHGLEKEEVCEIYRASSCRSVFVWVVMLVINIGLKMAPPDNFKQVVSQTWGQDPVLARMVCRQGFQVCSPSELVLRPEMGVILPATVATDEKLKYNLTSAVWVSF